MNIRLYVAILAIALPFSLNAQSKKSAGKAGGKAAVNYKVSWGPDLKLKGSFPDKILLYDKTGFYATTESGSKEFLSKFNNRMELELQTKIETEKSDKRM